MRAIDTNVLVRLLVADDPGQSRAAVRLFREHDIFIPVTVLLETEWVLRRGYRKSSGEIADLFRKVGGIATVTIEDSGLVAAALDLTGQGADFADALHLVRSSHCVDFATFDRALVAASASKATLLQPELQ